MIAQGLEKIIQKFEEISSFHVQSGRGWKRVNLAVVEGVATTVQEESSSGLQHAVLGETFTVEFLARMEVDNE
ncbi:hypothetical protein TNCV_444591 [Trichonephila clavipes]|nr:hypothetical protein TNCV_444591 [Trichonephila clavipes]